MIKTVVNSNSGEVLFSFPDSMPIEISAGQIVINDLCNRSFIKPFFNQVTREFYEGATIPEKAAKIEGLKRSQYSELVLTDWYVIRKVDTGAEIPAEIENQRAAIRSKYDLLINELLS